MTFVPIGWNVVLWGVKSRLELGQGIGEDGGRSALANPMRGKRHKIQKRLQKSLSQMEAAKAEATEEEKPLK
jgi:hypothetical protein